MKAPLVVLSACLLSFSFAALSASPQLGLDGLGDDARDLASTDARTAAAAGPAPPTDGTRLTDGAAVLAQLSTISVTYADRYAGSPKYVQAMNYIAAELTDMGLVVEKDPFGTAALNNQRIQNWPITGATSPSALANVCAYYPSKDFTKEWVILGAHYDSTEGGNEQAALDNGSGTALVLELARLMSQYEWDRVLVFCLWGGEEDGVLGSTFYASQLANSARVQMYINLDMVGMIWPGTDTNWEHHWTVSGPIPYDQNDKMEEFARGIRKTLLFFPDARFTERTMPENPGCLLSDYLGFQAIGVPYFVLITGLGNPMCSTIYPIHGTGDSYPNFVTRMGGTANAEAGFANQGDYVFYLVANSQGVNFRVPV